jgi:TonB-dependent receptor
MALVGGLRYEYTKNDYTGTQILLNPDGSLKAEVPIPGNKSYGDLLPMVHARFRLDEQTNLRAAVTRTLARPNYTDLAPSEFVDSGALTISRGNTNLDATTSWNFDLMGERYLSSVGVLSAGVFHKRLSSYIVPTTYTEVRDGVTYRVTQPVNGESATLTGFEVAFQNQFRSLPGILSGLGFYVNYTFADSSATFPGRTETSPLPGQAKHVGNVALSYERGGFAGRVGLNYSGHYINGVGVNATKDTYVDNHVQLDFAATQRIFDFLRFYVNVLNLTNEPLRVYEGVSDRPIQEEHYKWWGTLGVKVEF